MQTGSISIRANKRVPFDDDIVLLGVNYSAAAFAMEIRNEPGDQGAALVTLGTTAAPAQGISCAYNAGFVDPETGVVVGASLIRIRINEATLEGLPYDSDPAEPRTYYYDLHVTPSGGKKYVFCAGSFVVQPGVTL